MGGSAGEGKEGHLHSYNLEQNNKQEGLARCPQIFIITHPGVTIVS